MTANPSHRPRSLRVDGEFRQTLDLGLVLTERVLDDAKIEAGNDDVIPSVSNSPERNIQHGNDLIPKWLMVVESDRAKKFLALGIAGIVRARVGLLLREVDLSAGAARDFVRV